MMTKFSKPQAMMACLVAGLAAVLGVASPVAAHDQSATIIIRSNGTVTTPGSWDCTTQFEVDYTRVFCLPPEQTEGQSKTCGEKTVAVRVLGRPATTGRLEGTAWCTGGGGENAECLVEPGLRACTDSVAAQPYLLYLNQVACQATFSGTDANWIVQCHVIVGHE